MRKREKKTAHTQLLLHESLSLKNRKPHEQPEPNLIKSSSLEIRNSSQPASPKSSVFVRSKSKRNLLKSPLFPDDDDEADASYDWWRPPTRQFPKLFGRQQKKRRQRHQKPTEEKVKAIIEL